MCAHSGRRGRRRFHGIAWWARTSEAHRKRSGRRHRSFAHDRVRSRAESPFLLIVFPLIQTKSDPPSPKPTPSSVAFSCHPIGAYGPQHAADAHTHIVRTTSRVPHYQKTPVHSEAARPMRGAFTRPRYNGISQSREGSHTRWGHAPARACMLIESASLRPAGAATLLAFLGSRGAAVSVAHAVVVASGDDRREAVLVHKLVWREVSLVGVTRIGGGGG